MQLADEHVASFGIEPIEPRSRPSSVMAPTRPLSPPRGNSISPKNRLLQAAARLVQADEPRPITSLAEAARLVRVPSLGRLSTDCPRSDSEGDTQPPKTGLDLPLIWEPPSLPVHDMEHPEPLLPALSSAEREVLVAEARAAEEQTTLRRLVFAVDSSGEASSGSAPSTPRLGSRLLPEWCHGSLAPRSSSAPQSAGWQTSLPPFYERAGPDDETLVFESRFESGNLRRAWQVGPRAYELDLYPDRSTDLHTRWFYFRVSNTRAGAPYTFLASNMSVYRL